MKVTYHRNFWKYLKKVPHKIEKKLFQRTELFLENPYNPILNNHSIGRAYPGWRSINITGDYRALFEIDPKGEAVFMRVGTHTQLY